MRQVSYENRPAVVVHFAACSRRDTTREEGREGEKREGGGEGGRRDKLQDDGGGKMLEAREGAIGQPLVTKDTREEYQKAWRRCWGRVVEPSV